MVISIARHRINSGPRERRFVLKNCRRHESGRSKSPEESQEVTLGSLTMLSRRESMRSAQCLRMSILDIKAKQLT
jgi:hypothetical protein